MTDSYTAAVDIITAAQSFVDYWRRNVNRGPFQSAVRVAADKWSTYSGSDAKHRFAFVRAAIAIRVGRGHAVDRLEPLIDIVRFAILTYEDCDEQTREPRR